MLASVLFGGLNAFTSQSLSEQHWLQWVVWGDMNEVLAEVMEDKHSTTGHKSPTKNNQKCTLQHLQSLTPSYFSPSLYYSLLHLFPPLCLILLPSFLPLSLSSNTSIIGPLIGSLLTSSDNTLSNILMASCLIWLKKRINCNVVTASPIPAHWRECKDQNWLDWATVEPLIISYWD